MDNGQAVNQTEALSKIDQLIQQKMEETGKTYLEVSRKMLQEFQENKEQERIMMDEAQDQKMQEYNQKEKLAVTEMMKSPMSSEEMDRVIQEHYNVHNQANPFKKSEQDRK